MVRKVHSAAAVVDVVDVALDEGEEPEAGVEVDVDVDSDAGTEVVGDVVVVVVGEVVVVVSAVDDVVVGGATATGSPTWESAKPTICHVNAVVRTRATTHAAAMRQLIML